MILDNKRSANDSDRDNYESEVVDPSKRIEHAIYELGNKVKEDKKCTCLAHENFFSLSKRVSLKKLIESLN